MTENAGNEGMQGVASGFLFLMEEDKSLTSGQFTLKFTH